MTYQELLKYWNDRLYTSKDCGKIYQGGGLANLVEHKMTYQELLDEFDERRAKIVGHDLFAQITDLEWAIQSILEKLRDGDKE